MQKVSKDIRQTQKIAENFLKSIQKKKNKNACVVGLYGNLGTGKTAFTQKVAKILGVKRKVNSPTFMIMNNYKLKNKNYKLLIHIDAYRLKNKKELLLLGWKGIISDPRNIIFIEWPENVKGALPKKHHKIFISHTKEGYRKFKIKKAQ
jgi:tRNA threonylcarbamoyladenosine biosynthesis protein TsaE